MTVELADLTADPDAPALSVAADDADDCDDADGEELIDVVLEADDTVRRAALPSPGR